MNNNPWQKISKETAFNKPKNIVLSEPCGGKMRDIKGLLHGG